MEAFIGSLRLPEKAVADALAVFRLIAEAEGKVHGSTMENIHFHELGTLDAMADVVSVCYLMHLLKPDRVAASPVHVGSGTVRTAHGELSVPAPATMELLKGIPIYAGEIRGELCTPTGAALLKHFVDRFGTMPAMSVEKIGYGTGTKEFPQANILRALLGDAEDEGERLLELSCNLDDSTPEDLGYAMEALFQAGALDVWYTPIGMKKSRPAVMLSCLGRAEQREALLRCLFRHTGTLGVREFPCSRVTLTRSFRTADTPWGPVRINEGHRGKRKAHADRSAQDAERPAGISRRVRFFSLFYAGSRLRYPRMAKDHAALFSPGSSAPCMRSRIAYSGRKGSSRMAVTLPSSMSSAPVRLGCQTGRSPPLGSPVRMKLTK